MGRAKIPIKKIENEAKRRVTFSKRRKGLFSKAEELCSQSNSRIAIVVFSGHGKMFTFGEPDSLLEECGLNGSPFASTSTYEEQQPLPLKQIPLDKQPQIPLAKQPKRKGSRKGKEKVCEMEALPSGSSSNNSSIVTGGYAEPSQYGSGCSSYNFSTGCGFEEPNGYGSCSSYNSSPMVNENGCYSNGSMVCYDPTTNASSMVNSDQHFGAVNERISDEDFFDFTGDQVFSSVFKKPDVISVNFPTNDYNLNGSMVCYDPTTNASSMVNSDQHFGVVNERISDADFFDFTDDQVFSSVFKKPDVISVNFPTNDYYLNGSMVC